MNEKQNKDSIYPSYKNEEELRSFCKQLSKSIHQWNLRDIKNYQANFNQPENKDLIELAKTPKTPKK